MLAREKKNIAVDAEEGAVGLSQGVMLLDFMVFE